MILVSYLPKVQAIDKAVALIAQLREGVSSLRCINLINIEAKNKIASADFLFKLLARCTDHSLIVEGSHLADNGCAVFEVEGHGFAIWPAFDAPASKDVAEGVWRAAVRAQEGRDDDIAYLLAPRTGEWSGLVNPLMRAAKEDGARVVAYFKSVHDQGLGLSTPAPAAAAKRRSAPSSPTSFDDSVPDLFLAFSPSHRELLSAKGFDPAKIAVSGYSLLFPAWKHLVTSMSGAHDAQDVVVFTRGEGVVRAPQENVVPNDALKVILCDILDVVAAQMPNAKVWVKPHPLQDVGVVEAALREHMHGSRSAIVYDPPASLAGRAALAVSTYSSTVIDTLAFGVPTIEYFFENEFFLKKHPGGSPFPALGAVKARTRAELEESVAKLLGGWRPPIDLERALGHKMDLSMFFSSPLDAKRRQ